MNSEILKARSILEIGYYRDRARERESQAVLAELLDYIVYLAEKEWETITLKTIIHFIK